MSRPRKITTKNCLQCNKLFNVAVSEVKRGNGKFCTLSCVCKYRNIYYMEPRHVRLETRICSFCNKKFQHRPYKSVGKFCSLVCKNLSKRGLQPGSPNQNIRRKIKEVAFSTFGEKCELCGYALAVDVHHLTPRSEGGKHDAFNLAVLCPNHHREVHIGILTKEDIFKLRKRSVEMPSVARVQENKIKTSTSLVPAKSRSAYGGNL